MAVELSTQLHELTIRLEDVTKERDSYRSLYQEALLLIKRLERGLLGPKTEKLPNDAQLTIDILRLVMGDESESSPPISHQEEDIQDETASKPRPTGRKRKPASVPRIDVEIIPPEVQLEGLQAFQRIGETTAEVTEHRRGGTVVVCYRRSKFVRKDKSKSTAATTSEEALDTSPSESAVHDKDSRQVFIAPTADLPIERGSAGPALLAQTIVDRFLDALSLHRIERRFAREDIPIARSTICGWHEALSELVQPLVEDMAQDARTNSPVLCTDATGVRVQAKERCAVGHFFVVIAPLLHVLFFYTKTHDSGATDRILSEYKGYLVADAHSIYDHLYKEGEIIEVGDWAHVRRYFHKSLTTDPERAHFGLGRIAALFKIERQLETLSPEEREAARQERSKPIVDEFFSWCQTEALAVVDQTPIKAAIRYATNQQMALERFLYDGQLPAHNNHSERELRREAVGRKNWGFLGTHDAGHVNAHFMSLLASAELHRLEPFAYLRDLFCLLPKWPRKRVLELAPAYWKKTLEETDAQKRLDSNIFRRISLGLDPL